jgi:hypothetical protein
MPILPYDITSENSIEKDESLDTALEQSSAEIPASYVETIRDNAFIGNIPFDAIIDGIQSQFDNYINIEDKTNYVDIFYDQLNASYSAANNDTETFQDDINSVLDDIHQKFIDVITNLFKVRLTLSITDIESESYDKNDIEFIIRRLYEFFILGARTNFKVAIANDVKMRIGTITDPKEYFITLRNMMINYSPLITTFGPMEFLKYRGDQEIIQFFETGKVTGNFLRKYSPKLYQNEEFEVELINYITMVQQVKDEVFNNGR